MTGLLRRFPSHHVALIGLPGLWAIVTFLLFLYWRCLQWTGSDTPYLETISAVVALAGIGFGVANLTHALRRRAALDAVTFCALIAVLAASILTDATGLLSLTAFSYGVVAPVLAREPRVPLPSVSLIPGFLLGGFLLGSPLTEEHGALLIVAGLCLSLIMAWQRARGGIPPLRLRGTALGAIAGVLAIPAAVLAIGGACETNWCHDPDTYGPAIERLRNDVPADAAVVTILDPGTYDFIFQRCRLESEHVYRAFYPVAEDSIAADLMAHITTSYEQVYGVFVDNDVNSLDPRGVVETALQTQGFPAQSTYANFVRIGHYGLGATAPPTAIDARFGDDITLASFALTTTSLTPGDVLGVSLEWHADAASDASAGLYLLDAGGALVTQNDAAPGWQTERQVVDRRGLAIPAGQASGDYQLCTAVYTSTGRLPVAVDGAPHDDLLCFTTVAIRAE
jgi:hypothetical protein